MQRPSFWTGIFIFVFLFEPGIGFSQSGSQPGESIFEFDDLVEIDCPRLEDRGNFSNRVFPLSVEKLRGTQIHVRARIKAENVAKPPNSWNGIKCMIHTFSENGDTWDQENDVYGTFDWKTVEFTTRIPRTSEKAELILGIENSSGKAWFKEISIRIIGKERTRPKEGKGEIFKPFKGHDLSRLRGVMIQPSSFEEKDLQVLVNWGVNHIRWQLLWGGFPNGPADTASVQEYHRWIETQCQKLDRILPLCEKHGILVVIDLHTPPGGRRNVSSEMRMFHEKPFQDAFLEVWEKIARRYKDNKAVWAYDLVNEPVEGISPSQWENRKERSLKNWRELAIATTKKIREIDPERAIILEPAPWGSPEGLDWFEPLEEKNIVYSVHMYIPHRFTHQGVHENASLGTAYPGQCEGKFWDEEQLRIALKPVIDFQRDYGVHIYLGEFSVIRWAPPGSARQYLSDCIEIFEENGWDWAYHAFREWDGWSLEHGPEKEDRRPTEKPTDRLELMLSWFGKNERSGTIPPRVR